ncbi:MAG: T9SS type A sorting domain-containing protein [Candidatus Latescibacteria bacterium]|nr:T9SS type A sorting domain-containing protein [Candidatus Latescibacterota bacterium]
MTCSRRIPSGVEAAEQPSPRRLVITGDFPNPVCRSTRIGAFIPGRGRVKPSISDHSGRRVATLLDREMQGPGTIDGTLDPRDFASGIYFARLRFGGESATRRVTICR